MFVADDLGWNVAALFAELRPHMAPRSRQKAPKTAQISPRKPQNSPRWLQAGTNRRQVDPLGVEKVIEFVIEIVIKTRDRAH